MLLGSILIYLKEPLDDSLNEMQPMVMMETSLIFVIIINIIAFKFINIQLLIKTTYIKEN